MLDLRDLSKGYEFPEAALDLSPEWAREYESAVEGQAMDRLGQDAVNPMGIAALAIGSLLQSVQLPAGAIHIGQELAFSQMVKAGQRLSTWARVVNRGERQGWLVVSIDLRVEDEQRNAALTGRATLTMPVSEKREVKDGG